MEVGLAEPTNLGLAGAMKAAALLLVLVACHPEAPLRLIPDAGLGTTGPVCRYSAETPEQLLTRIGCELGLAAEAYEGFPPGRENNIWMALKDAQSEVETNIPNVR